MAPEVQRVVVGRVVGLAPADEVDERLLVTHVALAPVGDGARGVRGHACRHVEELGRLPVATTLVVAGSAVGQGRDLYVGVGAGAAQLQLQVLDDVLLEVVVPGDVDHHGPLGRRRSAGGAVTTSPVAVRAVTARRWNRFRCIGRPPTRRTSSDGGSPSRRRQEPTVSPTDADRRSVDARAGGSPWTQLMLSEPHDLVALRALMAMEPVPGQPLPTPTVLEKIHALVPCDEMEIAFVDMTGLVTAGLGSPRRGTATPWLSTSTCTSSTAAPSTWASCTGGCIPPRLVVRQPPPPARGRAVHRVPQRHRPRRPVRLHARQQALHRPGARAPGPGAPSLQRLARERPTPRLPATLTITERRILCDVAAGLQQRRDRRGLLRRDQHRAQAPRERLPQARRRPTGWPRSRGSGGATSPAIDLVERAQRYA